MKLIDSDKAFEILDKLFDEIQKNDYQATQSMLDNAWEKWVNLPNVLDLPFSNDLEFKQALAKDGDSVFVIYEGDIVETIMCAPSIKNDGRITITLIAEEDVFQFREPDSEHDTDPTDYCNNVLELDALAFKNTVFFTREEAEEKLEQLKQEANYERE